MNGRSITITAIAVLGTLLVAGGLSSPLQAGRAAREAPAWLTAWRSVPYTTVTAGTQLKPTESIKSPNGKYFLRYQKDGRLGLYVTGGTRVWTSGTTAVSVGVAVMQPNGSFACRGADNAITWSTGTGQYPGAILAVRDDGDVVILSTDKRVVWARPGGTWSQNGGSADVGQTFG